MGLPQNINIYIYIKINDNNKIKSYLNVFMFQGTCRDNGIKYSKKRYVGTGKNSL